MYVFNYPDFLIKFPREKYLLLSHCLSPGFSDVSDCCQKTGNSMYIQSSCFQIFRKNRRLPFVIRVHAGAAFLQWSDMHIFSNQNTTCTLGTHEALMACKTQYINMHFLHVHRHHTCRLRSIHHLKYPVLPADIACFIQIRNISRYIGCMLKNHGLCIRTNSALQIFCGNSSFFICR